MVFWILIAVITALAALTVLVPLSRAKAAPGETAAHADEAVYQEQLKAIDGELKRGLIDPESAEAARTEVARRLLAAHDKNSQKREEVVRSFRLKLARVLAIVALPLMALGVYYSLGSPDLPDQPLIARLSAPADQQNMDILVARVERHLAEHPEDGHGWSVIAPVYFSINQPQAAARAYANAIRILGPRSDWLTDMGEALMVANQGLITADARQAFEQAMSLDAAAIKPRFFLAIAFEQDGNAGAAIDAWENMLEGANEGAAWVDAARQRLALLKGQETVAPATRGPTQEDIAAAQDMSEEDRQPMVDGMVSGLAERLSSEGGTVEEWNLLIRAYMVLGERQQAENALADAKAAYADKPEQLSLIKDMAGELGLTGS